MSDAPAMSDMGSSYSAEPTTPSVKPEPSNSPSNFAPVPLTEPKKSIAPVDAAPPKPKKTPEKPQVEPKIEPKVEAPTSPSDDLFGPPSTPAPKLEPAQNDDLFSVQPSIESATKAAAPADDLFSPLPNEPAMKPAAPADDLFSTPPSNEPAMKPAAPPVDDLFGPPITNPGAAPGNTDDLFGNPAPANTPAPSNSIDDLFGAPPTANPPATPAGGSDLDSLFKSTQSDFDAERPFETSKPVSIDVDSDPNFDNLFGNPGSNSKVDATNSKASENSMKPESESERTPLDSGFDNLFKSTSAPADKAMAPEDEAFRGAEFREWFDNTGDYSVKARLVVIYPDRVRLIKENGKFSTVPMSRLCNADRDYVNWVAVSLGNGPAAKFVNTDTNPASRIQDMAR